MSEGFRFIHSSFGFRHSSLPFANSRNISNDIGIMQHLREEILSIVNHADYKAMKPKLIAKRLGLTGDEAETVRKTVKKMVREGLLAYGSNHMVFPVFGGVKV
jgi:hypothetical protein